MEIRLLARFCSQRGAEILEITALVLRFLPLSGSKILLIAEFHRLYEVVNTL